MRSTLGIALLVVGLCATPTWAQFGGGGGMSASMEGVFGGMEGGYGEMGMGGYDEAGYGPGIPPGIRAYGRPANGEGKFQVTWSGPGGAESQKVYDRLLELPAKIQFVDTPLTSIVQFLENSLGATIVIDELALEEEGVSTDLPITMQLTGLNASVMLDLLTERSGLGWYVDKGAIVLTSQVVADTHTSIRIYQLNRLNADGAKQIVEKMVAPGSWQSQEGPADIVAVADRNLLVIRQNHAGHTEVESLLKSLEAIK